MIAVTVTRSLIYMVPDMPAREACRVALEMEASGAEPNCRLDVQADCDAGEKL